jgi:hypothetical protein
MLMINREDAGLFPSTPTFKVAILLLITPRAGAALARMTEHTTVSKVLLLDVIQIDVRRRCVSH